MDVSDRVIVALERHGFDFFCGVPCSYLGGLFARLERRDGWIAAVREDVALGLAAGAWLGGRTPVVLMQNSGLGTSLNVLLSLSTLYRLPSLLVTSWRGEGGVDAPEHVAMGLSTPALLDLARIPNAILDPDALDAQIAALVATMHETRAPVALVVRKGLCQ